jgi:hypothetical protein
MVSLKPSMHIYRLAQLWVRGLSAVAGTIFLGMVSIVVGLASPAGDSPAVDLLRQHAGTALAVGGALVLATLASVIILWGPASPTGGPEQAQPSLVSRLVLSMALSTISTVLFIGLLTLVLVHPAWCPKALCPSVAITRAGSVHDDNLELYFTALQSDWYSLGGNPSQYGETTAPRTVGALRLADAATHPYRVVLGIHSLQRGRFGLVVERVQLMVTGVPPITQPVNAWFAGRPAAYTSQLFTILYHGEPAGARLDATYAATPTGFVQLVPGEADTLAMEIDPRSTADLHFQISVTYRVTNDSRLQTLTLPQVFEVIFSDASNWHPYHLQAGRFVPGA